MSPVETIRRLPHAAGRSRWFVKKIDIANSITGAVMTDAAFDHPDVIVFPPLIPLSTLVIACLLQWLVPLGWIADLGTPLRVGLGAIIVLAGLVTTSAGRRALIKGGTNVN